MGDRRAPTQILNFSPSNPFLVRGCTFLKRCLLDSQELLAPVRWRVLGTSVHFFIQAITEMFSVSILWQALRGTMGRWMWKQVTYNWVVYLTAP